ncbi:MAG TPA: SBBP repeat-containing protein, partial [Pyrinomonadaceae bacterium]|nr:SBBP repeat-containing protein [Pyrinomonadaceae bacterium]
MSLPFPRFNYHAHALLCFVLALSLNWIPATFSGSNTLAEALELDAPAGVPANAGKRRSELRASHSALPLSFEANQGQTNNAVKFLARAGGHLLFLTPTETVMALYTPADDGTGKENRAKLRRTDQNERNPLSSPRTIVRMKFEGANPAPIIEGVNELPGRSNYFSGSDRAQWQINIPTYARVRYRQVYPGIDMVYYGSQRQLEYDLVVAPDADSSVVEFRFAGVRGFEISHTGELVLQTAHGSMRQSKPIAYQIERGARQHVSCSYTRKGAGGIGFQLGDYDHSKPLIIDPVLVYSSYLGGNGWDQAYDIAVDSVGNAYVTGKTAALDFPTTPGAFQTSFGLGDALFVAKLNPEGTGLVYSTYINGASGNGIAVDFAGNAYVTGEASTPNFPTTPGAFQTEPWGFDTFVTKLNAMGSALVYSARFGGNFDDFGRAIALDAAGNAYITGWTVCRGLPCGFPTVNAFQPNYGGGYNDAFVTKINSQGSALVYSTYLGGGQIINASEDWGEGIAVDSSGCAYVTGHTYSPDFPITPGAHDTSRAGLDAFVTKFTPDGKLLVYSTLFGGTGREMGMGIDVDINGYAYVAGVTESIDFPVTPGAFQTTGSFEAFVTKFNPQGSGLVYSTYLGGTGGVERGWGIAVDIEGNAYITGDTKPNSQDSNNFPVANAIQGSYGGGLSDAFLSKLNATGTALVYSTYIGGNLFDEGRG